MHTFQFIIQLLAAVFGSLAALVSIPLFFRVRWPAVMMWSLKIVVSALSPVLLGIGILTAIAGLLTASVFISLIGLYTALAYCIHIISVTRPPNVSSGFEQAFGSRWENNLSAEQKAHFLPRRMSVNLPAVPRPRLNQNVAFATLPGTDRKLLCDVWQPPEGVPSSGLALIYLHGGAWYILDKDLGTRPFFRQLAAQGHLIMDVAYRMAPETGFMGMIHDVKRAIVWLKERAGAYGIDPACIVVGGGSAGAHLALLAAYAANNPAFTTADLAGKDVSVCAVISLYGQCDLETMYDHANQDLISRTVPGRSKKMATQKVPGWIVKAMGKNYHRLGFDKFGTVENVGTLPPLLGGVPRECPGQYALFAPVSYVHANCPPTLIVHGAHDCIAPLSAAHCMYRRLREENVPAVMHVLPQTDHGFDLCLARIAPAAHNVIYDIERFLALMAVRTGVEEKNAIDFNKTNVAARAT